MIYLDYAANTPVEKEVLKDYVECTTKYIANPNSMHKLGLNAKKRIDDSTNLIAKYFNTTSNSIIYTSGSSESNNLVIKGIADRYKEKGKHIIISSLEHSSIIAPCNYLISKGYEVDVLSINKNGTINIEELKSLIRDDTILVSVCYVDSELGTIQPIKEIAAILKKYPNCFFHTDATQAIGKINVDLSDCDFITFAPHKFFGLNGFGCLINKNNIKLTPLIHGGKSTTIYRSGTPVTAQVSAMSVALKLALENLPERYEYILGLNNYIKEELSVFSNVHINSPKNTIPNTINFSLKGIKSKNIVSYLEKNNIFVSTQSACSLGTSPSKSVLAITKNKELALNSIRVSLSHLTTKEEINTFIKCFKTIYDKELQLNEDNKN